MTMKTRIEIDAGRRIFSSGLLPELIAALRCCRPGDLLAVIGREADIGADLETWCRFTRNTLIDTTTAADHTILVRDLLGIEEATELLGLGVGRDGRRQPHPKLFRASALDTAPCARPRAPAAMAVVPRGLRAVEADLQGHTIARQ